MRSKMTGRCFLTPLPPAALLPHAGRAGDAEAVRLTCCIPQPRRTTGAKQRASAGGPEALTMLDAWKDCEVLNTHEGQIICRGHPRPRTRTFSADRFPQALCRKAPRTRAERQIICQAEHAAGADLLSCRGADLLPSGTGPQGASAGRRRSAEHTRTRTLNPSRTRTPDTLNTQVFLPADRPRRQAQSQSREAYLLLRKVPRGRFSASQRGRIMCHPRGADLLPLPAAVRSAKP